MSRCKSGSRGSVSGRALDFGLIGVSTCGFESHQGPFRSLTFPPVLRDWVIKGFGMSSLVYATGHIKDPVPLVEKSRGLSPGGRFPPSFIHQVIIITGLNKLQLLPPLNQPTNQPRVSRPDCDENDWKEIINIVSAPHNMWYKKRAPIGKRSASTYRLVRGRLY